MAESSELPHDICAANPFTYTVELIRFAPYLQCNGSALGWTLLATAVSSLWRSGDTIRPGRENVILADVNYDHIGADFSSTFCYERAREGEPCASLLLPH